MSRAFKPGDVVVATAEWSRGEVSAAAAQKVNLGWERLGDGAFARHVLSARPLVLVDPEDGETAGRLSDSLIAAMCKSDPNWDDARAYEVRAHMRTALREFADPKPPKPDEPTGWLARVEDARGREWMRVWEKGAMPWVLVEHTSANGRHLGNELKGNRAYDQIDAVEVLSEGVTP